MSNLPDNFNFRAFDRAHDCPSPWAEDAAAALTAERLSHNKRIADVILKAIDDIEAIGAPQKWCNHHYDFCEMLSMMRDFVPETTPEIESALYDSALAEMEEG